VSATSVAVSGNLTAPPSFTLPFSKLAGLPTTLAGYGITNAEPALGNPSTDGYVLSSTAAGARSWVAPGGGGGGSLTLDTSVTAVGFSDSGGTLYLANINAAGGLVQLDGSGRLPAVDGSQLTNLPGGGGGGVTWPLVSTDGNLSFGSGAGTKAYIDDTGNGSFTQAVFAGSAFNSGSDFSSDGSLTLGGGDVSDNGRGVLTLDNGFSINSLVIFDSSGSFCSTLAAGSIVVSAGAGNLTTPLSDHSTAPANTATPAGWTQCTINGTTSWIPYYR
jgi:hypothetical protein